MPIARDIHRMQYPAVSRARRSFTSWIPLALGDYPEAVRGRGAQETVAAARNEDRRFL